MSWSRSFESLEDFMHDRGTPDVPQGDGGQYARARQAAEHIIESGCVGGNGSLENADTVRGANDKDFRVFLSGHANPDHEPMKGWSNDSVTVTVTQK
jgi:hypothetical protein